jgi:hypothetical protein
MASDFSGAAIVDYNASLVRFENKKYFLLL